MPNSYFSFRQFTVHQDSCAMKVGTDGVLLGAWAEGGSRILDVGTGTGLIALMMAQRFAGAQIVGLDIVHEACVQASANVAASPFAGRVGVVESAVQQYEVPERFDSIVSNPPFFVNSLLAPDAHRALARHSCALPYAELFASVRRLLAHDGVFSAIIPAECLQAFVSEACLSGFSLTRRCAVKTTVRKPARRYLLAFRQQGGAAFCSSEEVLQNPDGSRTEWYESLTHDFYVK